MRRQYAVMILIEEQDVDEEGEVILISEAREPITLENFDTLEGAENYLSRIRESAET